MTRIRRIFADQNRKTRIPQNEKRKTMKEVIQKPSLDRPATYQIKVPGELDESWSDWAGGMTITVESEGEGPPVTILTGTVDQAALQSLLRRLYSLGLPLISVIFVAHD
jgi:hypothetical protein